jgi:hypothetical protein
MCSRAIALDPNPLQIERLPSGRRSVLRDYVFGIGNETKTIRNGFDTDYSSWPRWILGPEYHLIDLAGLGHDGLFRDNRMDNGRRVSFLEANRIWYAIARKGHRYRAHLRMRNAWRRALRLVGVDLEVPPLPQSTGVGIATAWAGRIGLLFSLPIWLRYRAAD